MLRTFTLLRSLTGVRDKNPSSTARVIGSIFGSSWALPQSSTRVKQFDRVRAVAERFDSVFCSIGTHPHNAHEELDVTADELVRYEGFYKPAANLEIAGAVDLRTDTHHQVERDGGGCSRISAYRA